MYAPWSKKQVPHFIFLHWRQLWQSLGAVVGEQPSWAEADWGQTMTAHGAMQKEQTLSWPGMEKPRVLGLVQATPHSSTLRANMAVTVSICCQGLPSLTPRGQCLPHWVILSKSQALRQESASQRVNSQPTSRARAVKGWWAPPLPLVLKWLINDF